MSAKCVRCGRPTDAAVCRPEAQELAEDLTAAAGHAEDAWTVIARQARVGAAGGASRAEPEPAGVDYDERRNRVKDFGWLASIERPPVGALRPEPTPADLGALDRLHAVENTIGTWARDLGSDADGVAEAARWLAGHVEELRRHPAADEAFRDLASACRQLERLVDRPADNRHLIGICNCGVVLYAPWNWTVIQCKDRTCGAVWSLADGQDILLRHLDDKLMTAGEAAKLAGYLDTDRTQDNVRKLIDGWARRSLLIAHGYVMRDPTEAEIEAARQKGKGAGAVAVPTYRFGDVREQLARTPRRNREGAAA